MIFRKAQTKDLDTIVAMVDYAINDFKNKGINQWQKGYPNASVLKEDISLGNLYVLEKDCIVTGMIYIMTTPESSYDEIEGAWSSPTPYASYHRVCVNPAYRGRGIAEQLFSNADRLCQSLGFSNIRIDTHEENLSMQRAILKHQFTLCGKIILKDCSEAGDPRIAYDKILKSDECH